MCINILPNQDIKTRGCIQTWILFVGVCFANISVGEFYCSYFFFMLIIFEMAGDLKFIATFQSFFFLKEFCMAIIIIYMCCTFSLIGF